MNEHESDLRIVTVTGLTTHASLRTLVKTALDAKNPAQTLPSNKSVIRVFLTPAANILVADEVTGDELTVGTGGKEFEVINALDNLTIKNVVAVVCELYFGR